jgi:hypothetical protein
VCRPTANRSVGRRVGGQKGEPRARTRREGVPGSGEFSISVALLVLFSAPALRSHPCRPITRGDLGRRTFEPAVMGELDAKDWKKLKPRSMPSAACSNPSGPTS